MRQGLKTLARRPNTQVAVSLGSGSVLLVGSADEAKCLGLEGPPGWQAQKTQGLVQLRILVLDDPADVQETSCYVSEDANTDSESETLLGNNEENSFLEAPSKPIPPPPPPSLPKETSMVHKLGQKMKMLQRTWSMTKGSLGRTRPKTSVIDGEDVDKSRKTERPFNANITNDLKKYFTVRKKSRKSLPSLSTFYLENNKKSDNSKEEEVYSNESLYGKSWKDDESSDDGKNSLYQFYTDAVARVALQSDSDGYEELLKRLSLTESEDLLHPGNSLLWCRTPQVISSGLLEKLNTEEKRIQEAKFEMLSSEVRYLNSLRILSAEFANDHELIYEVLTPGEKERLFGGVPSALAASENFLEELESVWKRDLMLEELPNVVLEHAERFLDVYGAYCSSQVCIDNTLKELKSRKESKFLETVSQIEMRPACQHLPLNSFLMLPMQRVTRLPLLADAVLSRLPTNHDQRSQWEKAFLSLSHVASQCNEGARLAGQRVEMQILEKKLRYPLNIKPIELRDRKLVRSGKVVQLSFKSDAEYKLTFGKKYHKTPLYLLVLTDYVLVTKAKSDSQEETYMVIDACKRNLITLESIEDCSPFSGHHAMILTLLENSVGRLAELTLACESDTERERWIDVATPPKQSSINETLYESWDCPQVTALYSYTATQPDELGLHVGDVINVLRKFADGWYQGEKLLDREQGWFPANYTKEIASEHVRARNLRQRHRFLALSGKIIQRREKS